MALIIDMNKCITNARKYVKYFFTLHDDNACHDDKVMYRFIYSFATFYGISLSFFLRNKGTEPEFITFKGWFLISMIPAFWGVLLKPKCVLPILLGIVIDRNVNYWNDVKFILDGN